MIDSSPSTIYAELPPKAMWADATLKQI